jgi:general secretion pathway protein K
LIVLWTLVLLVLLVTQLTAAGRRETRIAANLRSGAAAEAAADGAVYEALFHLEDSSAGHWNVDGTLHRVRVPHGVATIRIRSEAGKVNPNTAPVALMAALLHNLGVEPQMAATVAAAIINWRTSDLPPQLVVATAAQYRAAGRDYGPPGAPFESLDELGLVLGMTPALLERLIPHLSIYQGGDPTPAAADPIVLRALAEAAGADSTMVGAGGGGAAPVSITAEVREVDGSVFVRHAIIRMQPTADGRPYQILAWDTPAS